MAYGAGRSRLIAEIGKEQAFEAKRYEEELTAAEKAAKKESEGASAWSSMGSTLAALGTFLTTGDLKATTKAWAWGGEAGKWSHRLASGYDPEDYALSTDMGRFDVQDAYKMEDVNRQFEEAHRAQFWQDIAGTGKTLGTLAYLGSDLGKMFTGSEILEKGTDVSHFGPSNVYRGQPGDFIRFGGGKSTLWETGLT